MLFRSNFVTPDDIKALAEPVMAHRLLLHNEARAQGVTPTRVVLELLAQVPVPSPRTR